MRINRIYYTVKPGNETQRANRVSLGRGLYSRGAETAAASVHPSTQHLRITCIAYCAAGLKNYGARIGYGEMKI